MFCVLLQKNEKFSRSFTFFAKEGNVLCFLLHSLLKNIAFFVFFYVLKKKTQKNAKECIVLLGLIICQKLKKRT